MQHISRYHPPTHFLFLPLFLQVGSVEGGDTWRGEKGREEEEEEEERSNAGEVHPWRFYRAAQMRRMYSRLEGARARLIRAERTSQETFARLADLVAARRERERARERTRQYRSMEGVDETEAGKEVVGRLRNNHTAELASTAGGVTEEGWGMVTSLLGRRVASLEEWRESAQAGREITREQRLAKTDALLRFAGDAREVATVFAGRWRDGAWDRRRGGVPR